MRNWIALATALLMALTGCTTPAPSPDDGPDDEAWMAIDLDTDTIEAGETLTATITFTNRGDEPFTYDHPGCPPEPFHAWVPAEGRDVRLYTYGEEPMASICVLREVTMQPGDELSMTVNWNAQVSEQQPDPHGGPTVDAGEYVLHAKLRRADQGDDHERTRAITVH